MEISDGLDISSYSAINSQNQVTQDVGTAMLKKAMDMLSEVKESIINAYELKTGLPRKQLSNMMNAESWMNAKKALELGFADSILYDGDDEGDEPEGMIFSRAAVTNSLLNKLKAQVPKPDNRVDASVLNKRLDLIGGM